MLKNIPRIAVTRMGINMCYSTELYEKIPRMVGAEGSIPSPLYFIGMEELK